MKRKNNKKLALLLILVLVISVGYAALASNLKINGSSNVKASSWNVYWDNVQIKEGSVPADDNNKARITDTAKTQVEFNVVLSEPGDFYEFTVDAVNNGTIDAMIAANGIVDGVYSDSSYTQTATLPEAVSYTVTYADGNPIQEKHLLAKKNGSTPTKETYKVRIEYRNDEEIDSDDLDDTDQTFYFKFSVNYVQADDTAVDSHPSAIHYITRQNEGQITLGDIIGIGETEDFYVISSNAEKTVLLSKYNLLVGNSYNEDTGWQSIHISKNTPGYGLQSVDAVGYHSGPNYATVKFSDTNYWMDGDNLKSKYSENGTIEYDSSNNEFINISDNTQAYPYVYDENSTIYGYISGEDGYVKKLKEMGAPSNITGRLLTYQEADAAQTIQDNGTSIMSNGQSYWLGSAGGSSSVWYVSSVGDINYDYYNNDYIYGVRPVIEIPTSEIE